MPKYSVREINTKTGYPVECARIEAPRGDSAVKILTEKPITHRETITLPNGKDIKVYVSNGRTWNVQEIK